MKQLPKEVQVRVREAMGYHENRCGNCAHYVPDDCSGNAGALPSHCGLNPGVPLFAITKDGVCDYWEKIRKISNE